MGLDPPYLGDREQHIQRFRDFLEEPEAAHNVLVTGLRGVGKTVLTNHYGDVAEGAGWVVVDREWSQNDSDPVVFRRLVLEDLARLALKLSIAERVKKTARDFAQSVAWSRQWREGGLPGHRRKLWRAGRRDGAEAP